MLHDPINPNREVMEWLECDYREMVSTWEMLYNVLVVDKKKTTSSESFSIIIPCIASRNYCKAETIALMSSQPPAPTLR